MFIHHVHANKVPHLGDLGGERPTDGGSQNEYYSKKFVFKNLPGTYIPAYTKNII